MKYKMQFYEKYFAIKCGRLDSKREKIVPFFLLKAKQDLIHLSLAWKTAALELAFVVG